ncbi:hypothetical protein TNCV_2435311 [Trichonephila clavipes]|nr:hypothetical protein TNCV_2435311 [Trichonephila clavipes]
MQVSSGTQNTCPSNEQSCNTEIVLLVVTGIWLSPYESPARIRLQTEPGLVGKQHHIGVHNECFLLQAGRRAVLLARWIVRSVPLEIVGSSGHETVPTRGKPRLERPGRPRGERFEGSCGPHSVGTCAHPAHPVFV